MRTDRFKTLGATLLAFALSCAPGLSAAHTQVVASGLDNPRGIEFGPEGALYVAEAGRGGDGPCGPSNDGGLRCYGETGAITRIDLRRGTHARIATGLPSLAAQDGSAASGAHDISFQGRGQAFVTIGFAGNPTLRTPTFGPAGASFARLARLSPSGHLSLQEDLGAFEAAHNPAGDEVDSNPYGLLALPGRRVVADAGANALIEVAADGSVSPLAVFPNRLVSAPPLPAGLEVSMDAVPTSVALGPDGHYYVSQLTGFPFPVEGANIYRVPPEGGTPVVFANRLTAVIDLAFGPDGSLYVLQIAKNGLLAAFGRGDWTGALIRIAPDGRRRELAAGELVAPGGIAVARDGSLYVSDHSIFAGRGRVLRILP